MAVETKTFSNMTKNNELREVAVYYSDKHGKPTTVHAINMAAHLTDEEIYQYFKKGKCFNLGCGGYDLLAYVDKIEILK